MFHYRPLKVVQHRLQAFRLDVLQHIAANDEFLRRRWRAEFIESRVVIDNAIMLSQRLLQFAFTATVIEDIFGVALTGEPVDDAGPFRYRYAVTRVGPMKFFLLFSISFCKEHWAFSITGVQSSPT